MELLAPYRYSLLLQIQNQDHCRTGQRRRVQGCLAGLVLYPELTRPSPIDQLKTLEPVPLLAPLGSLGALRLMNRPFRNLPSVVAVIGRPRYSDRSFPALGTRLNVLRMWSGGALAQNRCICSTDLLFKQFPLQVDIGLSISQVECQPRAPCLLSRCILTWRGFFNIVCILIKVVARTSSVNDMWTAQ